MGGFSFKCPAGRQRSSAEGGGEGRPISSHEQNKPINTTARGDVQVFTIKFTMFLLSETYTFKTLKPTCRHGFGRSFIRSPD